MKDFEKLFIAAIEGFVDDYSVEELVDELFPGMTVGELFLGMYEHGMIPEEDLERFLEDE